MQTKGQLFATDFLIAMVIIIIGFGTLAAALEFNMYQNKGTTNYNILTEKSEAAAITLANATWADCNFDTARVAYSINTDKIDPLIGALTEAEVKKRLGLFDTNTYILITYPDSTIKNIVTDSLFGEKNISTMDLNILTCNNSATFADMNGCMTGAAACTASTKIRKATLQLAIL